MFFRGKRSREIRISLITFALLFALVAMIPCISRSADISHPTLYFTAGDLAQLRAKGSHGLASDIRNLLLSTADQALQTRIPKQPNVERSRTESAGTFDQEEIITENVLFQAGRALQAVMPVLGLGYYLTGNRAYAQRAIEWLDRYSRWQGVLQEKPDIAGSATLNGLIVGYDMLYQDLSPGQRDRLLKTITLLTEKFVRKTNRLLRLPQKGNRAQIGNNHNIVPACAAGMGALLLKIEGVDDGRMLKTVVDCFRDVIIPSGFSPQGEYVDGSNKWLLLVIQEMTLFFEALRRNGGPDLWGLPNIRAILEFTVQANSLCAEDSLLDYRWRYVLLAMASAYRDPEIQGIALRPGFFAGPGRKIAVSRLTEDDAEGEEHPARTRTAWTLSAWEYIFYDPTLKPAPLKPRPLSVLFPHLGRVIMRSSWKKDASIVTFRAGPRVGKEEGDNNAFQLTAFGVELLPKLRPPFWPLQERGREWHLERDWILGTKGNNTIIVDGVRQYSALDPRFKGINRRQAPPSDWLSSPSEGIPATGRILSFVTSPVADYVCGEAANAYTDENGRPLLDRFSRHLFFVKDEYLVVLDEIKGAGGQARNIEWIFHAGKDNELLLEEHGFLITPRENDRRLTLRTRVMVPQAVLKIERVPAKEDSYRSPYVSISQSSPRVEECALFVMQLGRGTKQPQELRVLREDDTVTLLALGPDFFVFNKSGKPFRYKDLEMRGRMAWIRPGRAAILVEGTHLSFQGQRLVEEPFTVSRAWVGR